MTISILPYLYTVIAGQHFNFNHFQPRSFNAITAIQTEPFLEAFCILVLQFFGARLASEAAALIYTYLHSGKITSSPSMQ
jgi:hypothetical protein